MQVVFYFIYVFTSHKYKILQKVNFYTTLNIPF